MIPRPGSRGNQRHLIHGHSVGQSVGHKLTSEYIAWRSAKQRVSDPHIWNWANYGGRGISMASEWLHDFAAFFAHIGPKPDRSYQLDRINNDGNYEPGNVRWATRSEQRRNRRKH